MAGWGLFLGLNPTLQPQMPSGCPSVSLFPDHAGSKKALVIPIAGCPVSQQAKPISNVLLGKFHVEMPPGMALDMRTFRASFGPPATRVTVNPSSSLPICEMGPRLPHCSDHADLCSARNSGGHLQLLSTAPALPHTRGPLQ